MAKTNTKTDATPKELRVTQIRSGVGRPEVHKRTLRALGFLRHQQTIIKQDNPAIRGMLFQVRHLVRVEEVAGGEA
ncbi:MAG: 50S ribosomal protein L30 [Longimicrobiales bacterium]